MRSIAIKSVFLTGALWWVYLFFTTQFIVVFDAEGYEQAGRMIARQGWAEFLRHGPQREPLFALIVALSMRLGDWWGIAYDYPLKMIGLVFLFLTMVFSYRLMRMLSISRTIACLAVFYLGISPTMTNSSLRLWSEFAAYPWVVLAVIWTIKSWKLLSQEASTCRVMGHAVMVAFMFLLVMSVKAVAEGMLLFYLSPFYWLIFSHWQACRFSKARNAAVFCLIVLLVFEGTVNIYRWANFHYNGQFAYTTRGDWAFYGNTVRRMQPLTAKRLGAAVLSVPNIGICPSVYSLDDCVFWTARRSDDIIDQKRAELNAQGVSDQAASRYYIQTAIHLILANPLQAIFLMIIEAHKMFFWESSVSFMAYPDWLQRILYQRSFIYVTVSLLALLSWAAFVFSFVYLGRHWQVFFSRNNEETGALFWVLSFIFWYSAAYSLFFIVDRYSFPLVSLYVVLMAFTCQKISESLSKQK